METAIRGRLLFEASTRPPSVTFDDGKDWRRNFPWVRFAGCHWSYAEPDVIQIEIDEWLVALRGHNLQPLFQAINEQKIVTIEARPECEGDPKHAADTFVTHVQFAKLSAVPSPQGQQASEQLRLGLG